MKRAATLHHLVNVRSRLAEELIEYLAGEPRGLVAELDPLPFCVKSENRPLTVTSIFVEPTVWIKDGATGAGRQTGESDDDVDDQIPSQSMFRVLARHLYEHDRAERDHQPRRWRHFIGNQREPTVLLGAPGGGKTCASRAAALWWAAEGARVLKSTARLPDEIVLPFWVTAADLARVEVGAVSRFLPPESANQAEAAAAVIAAHAARTGQIFPASLIRFFVRAMVSGQAFVVVDSLDELPHAEEFENRMLRRLAALRQTRSRFLLTCRTKDWEQRSNLCPSCEVAELRPLRARDHRAFLRRFFVRDADRRTTFERRLAESDLLRQACETPLLLTYAALLQAEVGLTGESALTQLYGGTIRGVVMAQWRKEAAAPSWARDPVSREEVLRHLASMAWRLFVAAPSSNSFSHSEVMRAFLATEAPLVPGNIPGVMTRLTMAPLLRDLLAVGLLIPGGHTGNGESVYSFTHRSVLEWLAAWHACLDYRQGEPWRGPGRPPPSWGPKIAGEGCLRWVMEEEKPFHFRAEWLQFLTFSAAILGDASPLIEALDSEPENIFGSTFALQCRLLSAAAETPPALAEALSRRWGRWSNSWDRSKWETRFEKFWIGCGADLCMCESARGNVLAGMGVSESMDATYWAAALRALSRVWVPKAREELLHALYPNSNGVHEEEDLHVVIDLLCWIGGNEERLALEAVLEGRILGLSHMRGAAATALGWLALPESRPTLEKALDPAFGCEVWTRGAAAQALGRLGMQEARPALELALDPNSETFDSVRRAAAQALGVLGAPEARAALETALKSTNEPSPSVRFAAAEALLRLGIPEAHSVLEEALDPVRPSAAHDRIFAAQALGRVGGNEARAALEKTVLSEVELDHEVRSAAVEALGRLRLAASRPLLEAELSRTKGSHPKLRRTAAEALGRLRLNESRAPLETALDPKRESSSEVRAAAAESLGRLCQVESRIALEATIDPAHESDHRVRCSAFEALGKLANSASFAPLLGAVQCATADELLGGMGFVRCYKAEPFELRAAADALWAIVSANPHDFRPGGVYADAIYQFPATLEPTWSARRLR